MFVCCVNIICVFLFVSTSHFDSMHCKNVCIAPVTHLAVAECIFE